MRDAQGISLRTAMTQLYCARLCYVLVTAVGFLLFMLILSAIGNLPNLTFKHPEPGAAQRHWRCRHRRGQRRVLRHPAVLGIAVCRARHRLRHLAHTALWQKRCRPSTCSRSAWACDLRARNLSNRRTSLCSLHSAPAARKNVAVIFITRIENGESHNEGLCLRCARELHIKPVDEMMEKLGISDADLDNLTGDVAEMLGSMGMLGGDGAPTRTPTPPTPTRTRTTARPRPSRFSTASLTRTRLRRPIPPPRPEPPRAGCRCCRQARRCPAQAQVPE